MISPGDEDCDLRARVSVAASRVEASRPLPDFTDMNVHDRTLPDGILLEHLKAFQTLYREHCEVDRHGPDRTCTRINNASEDTAFTAASIFM